MPPCTDDEWESLYASATKLPSPPRATLLGSHVPLPSVPFRSHSTFGCSPRKSAPGKEEQVKADEVPILPAPVDNVNFQANKSTASKAHAARKFPEIAPIYTDHYLKIMVAGEAGQGKTTMINNFFMSYRDGQDVCMFLYLHVCLRIPRAFYLTTTIHIYTRTHTQKKVHLHNGAATSVEDFLADPGLLCTKFTIVSVERMERCHYTIQVRLYYACMNDQQNLRD